jgi:Cu(I)/Ag(I) efflux system membrane fusion protein/cobalt-zinc-cadmium efflux system membrane fusion protein
MMRMAIVTSTAVAVVALSLLLGAAAGCSSHREAREASSAQSDTSASEIVYYTCSMHPQVMQDKPGVCPICNMKLVPVRRETKSAAAGTGAGAGPHVAGAKERTIAYYWDPMMNPPYISSKPGKSPMGMDLIPVYEDEAKSGLAVTIDPVVTQNMGLRVDVVTEGPLSDVIRTVGYFRAPESGQHDVTLKVGGYIERLFANTAGVLVEKGAPLFDLYSPDLLVAEEELVAAKRALDALPPTAAEDVRSQSKDLLDNVRRKLEIWDVPAKEIDRLLASGATSRTVTFRSPATGFIVEKSAVEGASVAAGERLFRIADLSTLWLDAQVYENDLPSIAIGQKATATVQGGEAKELSGEVVFIDPSVSETTRTAAARLEFKNPGFALKPGLFANVEIAVSIAKSAIQIPREAVLDTGKRRIVFIARAGGRFEPREVRVGAETSDGVVQILAGLAPGDTIVTSGQLLLDTESRTREAIEKMRQEKLLKKP